MTSAWRAEPEEREAAPERPAAPFATSALPGRHGHDPRALASAVGNQAMVAHLARRVGWQGQRVGSPNAGASVSGAEGGMRYKRLPLDGIKGGAYTERAIVLVPDPLPANVDRLDVLLHLHGHTRGYKDDNRGKADDEGIYQIGAQLSAAGRPMIGILPQGSAKSHFGNSSRSRAFDADTYIGAVFSRLQEEGDAAWGGARPPAPGRVALSGHSGADIPILEMLEGRGGIGKLEPMALFLFDSMYAKGYGKRLWKFVGGRLQAEVDRLREMREAGGEGDAVEAAMVEGIRRNGLRVTWFFRKHSTYRAAAEHVRGERDRVLRKHRDVIGGPESPVHQALLSNYVIKEEHAGTGHMDVVGKHGHLRDAITNLPPLDDEPPVGDGEQPPAQSGDRDEPEPAAPAGGQGAEPPARAGGNGGDPAAAEPEDPWAGGGGGGAVMARMAAAVRARAGAGAPTLARRDAAAGATKTVTVRWDTARLPRNYLKSVLEDHPPDWNADVYVGGKLVGSGDGQLAVTITEGKKHTIKVVPKAKAPDNYFLPGTKRKVDGSTDSVAVKLRYNRSNSRFTDRSWEHKGIDPAKAKKTTSTRMFGRRITVNELVVPTVEKTNAEYAKLEPGVQEEIQDSLAKIGGYNRRTTSEGDYSNHSTGCAVDINALSETKQNIHWKSKTAGHKEALALFAHVLQREPGWESYDPWKEKDAEKTLEASELFNRRFPDHLGELLADARGGKPAKDEPTGLALVQSTTPASLRKAAKEAQAAGRAETAKWLDRIAGEWTAVRGWVEGIVVYGHDDKDWAYVSDHQRRVAEGQETRKVLGTVQGMVGLHPDLVRAMLAGGWSWLIDQQHAKDFMHFEDRAAMQQLVR